MALDFPICREVSTLQYSPPAEQPVELVVLWPHDVDIPEWIQGPADLQALSVTAHRAKCAGLATSHGFLALHDNTRLCILCTV